MAFIPGVTDVLDANGVSLIQRNADGSVPVVAVQLADGMVGSFAKNGAIGIVTIGPDPSSPIFAGAIAGTSLSIGAQTPPQFQIQPGATTLIASGSSVQGTILVPVGMVVEFEIRVLVHVTMTAVGIFLPATACAFYAYANYGTSGPILVTGPVLDTLRTSGNTAFLSSLFSVAVTDSTHVQLSANAFAAPAWATSTTYAGSFKGGTTPPNAIADPGCSFVQHGGNLYVCTVGVVSSSTAPTGVGTSPITPGDGSTWYCIGPASAGLPIALTLTTNAIYTG